MMLDFGSKQTVFCVCVFFFLLLCITSRQFVSGCGCAPVTRLASCSANMQRLFVAVPLTSVWFVFVSVVLCCCFPINFTSLDSN